MATEWTLPRHGEHCFECRRSFEPGESFDAWLFHTDQGYDRRDICARCTPPDAGRSIGHWRTRRPQPAARKSVPFDRESIFAFFERLADADRPEQLQFRFVLALLLWRKKALKLIQTTGEGDNEIWEFAVVPGGSLERVRRPANLEESQIEQLSIQLENLLAGRAESAGLAVLSPAEGATHD